MIISQCPRCHEGFRVPSGPIPADAYAHCPWCRETFPIAEVLGSLPPTLEIISAEGKPLAMGEPATEIGSGLQLAESTGGPSGVGSLGSLADRQRHDDFESFEVRDEDDIRSTIADETASQTIVDENWHRNVTLSKSDRAGARTDDDDPYSTWDGSESSGGQSMNVATKSNHRKRKSSGIGTFVGIVLGGLASVPIAGGLLALMGRTPDWGFWPFQGEQASSSVRAAPLPNSDSQLDPISPAAGTPLRFDRDQPGLEQSPDPTRTAARQIIDADLSESSGDSASIQAMQVAETSDPVSTDPVSTAPADYSAVVSSDEPVRREIGDQEAAGSEPANSATAAQSDPSAQVGEPAAAALASPSTVPPPTVPPPTTVASSKAEELALRASLMIDAMSEYQGDEAERQRRIGVTYQRIAAAAGLLDEPDESLESLAKKIVESPLRDDIRAAGWVWLVFKNRETDGVALIGRANVTDEAEILTSDSGDRIALISEGEIPDGQEVLVMGRLVNQGSSLRVVYAQPIP